jgi:hypothetical protein
VPDHDRLGVQRPDDLCVVRDLVVDALVSDQFRVLTRFGYRGRLSEPSRRDRLIAGLSVQVKPRTPAGGVQPEAVDEHNWGA